jgi:hypothetical protein
MWLISRTISYLHLATKAIEVAICERFENFVGAGQKFSKEEMKQRSLKSVPAIARLLSLRTKLFAP